MADKSYETMPSLTPQLGKSNEADFLGSNEYESRYMVELELAKLRIVQKEKEMELERLRQGSRECSCHNKSPYKPSTSHKVSVSPNDESARTISKFLDMLKAYQYFKWNADELECWINEKLQTYTNEDFNELSNLQLKKQKHQELEFEVTVHAETLSAL
ncbi:unnamed protein product, partial [Trichobilharzia szidati]